LDLYTVRMITSPCDINKDHCYGVILGKWCTILVWEPQFTRFWGPFWPSTALRSVHGKLNNPKYFFQNQYTVTLILIYNSMEQSPSWEVNSHSASQIILRLLWKPQVHNSLHKFTPLVPILSQTIRPSPRPCVTIRNKLSFYGEELLAFRTNS
jgi:hypothetical protein